VSGGLARVDDNGSIRASAPFASSALPLAVGVSLGRYILLRPIGGGGMGAVWEALDSELERRLAVKVLAALPTANDGNSDPLQASNSASLSPYAMLLAEAQAQARLAHPHIVPVYDVGKSPYGVYVAMELVDGPTLKAWSTSQPRDWRETLALYIAAGQGIVAAHDAGLIHRDIKPENLLIHRDGRVMVADFGLAASVRSKSSVDASNIEVAGTHSYMSIEQHQGKHVGVAADQYSFCVALFEGIYGKRPFSGQTTAQIIAAIQRGLPWQVPAGARAPKILYAILQRGLSAQAEDRYPSMRALLDELQQVLDRRAWPAWTALAGVVITCVAAIALSRHFEQRHAACEQAAEAINDIWSSPLWNQLSIETAKLPSRQGNELSSAIEAIAGERIRSWRGVKIEACLARPTQASWSNQVESCLDANLAQDRAFAALIGGADPGRWQKLPRLIRQTQSPEICLRATTPQDLRDRPHDENVQGAYLSLVRDIDSFDNDMRVGALTKPPLELLNGYMQRAKAIGSLRAGASLALLISRFQSTSDLPDVALATSSYGLAMLDSIHDDQLTTSAMSRELFNRGYVLGAVDDIEEQLEHAHAHALRAEDSDIALADWCVQATPYWSTHGFGERSLSCLPRAIEVLERRLGANSNPATTARDYLATSLLEVGAFSEAEPLYARIVRDRSNELGGENVGLAHTLLNLSTLLAGRGAWQLATEHLTHAYQLAQDHASDFELVGHVNANYIRHLIKRGDLDRALRVAKSTADLFESGGKRQQTGPALAIETLLRVSQAKVGDYAQACENAAKLALAVENSTIVGLYAGPSKLIATSEVGWLAGRCGEEDKAKQIATRIARELERSTVNAADHKIEWILAMGLQVDIALREGTGAFVAQSMAKHGLDHSIEDEFDDRSGLMSLRRNWAQVLLDAGDLPRARQILELDVPSWNHANGGDLRATWRDQVAWARLHVLEGDAAVGLSMLDGLPEQIAPADWDVETIAELEATRAAALRLVDAAPQRVARALDRARIAIERARLGRPGLRRFAGLGPQ
jgi:tetratricopeptide (TPR) repeat protein